MANISSEEQQLVEAFNVTLENLKKEKETLVKEFATAKKLLNDKFKNDTANLDLEIQKRENIINLLVGKKARKPRTTKPKAEKA